MYKTSVMHLFILFRMYTCITCVSQPNKNYYISTTRRQRPEVIHVSDYVLGLMLVVIIELYDTDFRKLTLVGREILLLSLIYEYSKLFSRHKTYKLILNCSFNNF